MPKAEVKPSTSSALTSPALIVTLAESMFTSSTSPSASVASIGVAAWPSV